MWRKQSSGTGQNSLEDWFLQRIGPVHTELTMTPLGLVPTGDRSCPHRTDHDTPRAGSHRR